MLKRVRPPADMTLAGEAADLAAQTVMNRSRQDPAESLHQAQRSESLGVRVRHRLPPLRGALLCCILALGCTSAAQAQSATLTLTKAGSGTGTVTSAPAGIACGGGDVSSLNDEFDDSATLGQWQRIYEVEQWGVDHLEVFDMNATQAGRMVMIPHASVWFQDYRTTLAFKEVTGDFVISTEIHVDDRDPSDGDQIPAVNFSLAGVMVRTPRDVTPATWTPGGENYVFLSLGTGGGFSFQFEVKTTVNSDSDLELDFVGVPTALIQIARIGDTVLTLRQLPGGSWEVHRRFQRSDFPATLQVGFVVYTDWGTARTFTPFDHNTTVLAGSPDLVAGFEYAHFARPLVPPALAGLDLTDPAAVSDADLLSFLGENPDADCSEIYDFGTVVTLTAVADPGSLLTGWSGDADCDDGVVTVGADKSCTAHFDLQGCGPETLNLTTGQWKQISLNCNPVSGNTVADVFAGTLSGTYDVDWVVYRWDASAQSNVKLALTDPLAVGEGYWIKTNETVQSVTSAGSVNVATDVALVTSAGDPPSGCGNSGGRCNMVGQLHQNDVCWADAQVIDGANTLSLSVADPSGVCQGTNAAANGCIMSRIVHKWTGSSYAAFDGITPGMEGTIEPWDAFWVSAVRSGIRLRMPIPAVPRSCSVAARFAGKGTGGWFIRLIAESGDLQDAANVLGQLPDSVIGYDSHDLEELSPFGSPFLTVVFPHDDWGDQAGAYVSDYHPLRPESEPDEWRFEVRASDPGTPVTLRWEGPGSRLLGSVLTDEETGQQVEVQPGGSYVFTLNGSSRSFRWGFKKGSSDIIYADGFESGDTNAW